MSFYFEIRCFVSSFGFSSEVNRGGLKPRSSRATVLAHCLHNPTAIDQHPETLAGHTRNIHEFIMDWMNEGRGVFDLAPIR